MCATVCFLKRISIVVWALTCVFFLPGPFAVSATHPDGSSANAHVLRRLSSPERAAAIAEAARLDAMAHESHERSEAVVAAPFVPRGERIAQTPPSASAGAAAIRPQSVTEALFNHGASFLGVPGLASQRGEDGSPDEGLGFHQDGTARKAGGGAGSSGLSANEQRARAYMRSGLQNGYAPGLYGAPHDAFWGRDDPTRGGRVSGSSGYSRDMGTFDPMSMAIDRGLNYGAGFVNSLGEAAISGLVDEGRARLNFRMDKDGYFNGEGDALLPFYDGTRTTVYTQLGARSMHDSDDTRWIGNFGLGLRWFPFAQGEGLKAADYDAGMLMLGYNAFFDYDFTRDHQRGGIGAEVWYDWLRLSSNYYFPLSGWKGSEDFDSRFVKERAAKGWDARVKAYLPFYRHIALTGAYSQWYGDHVGMFGASKLEQDPKVWSYGLEYMPVPLVSGFVTQKSTERGRTDTEFGLNFTYYFQMPWEEQITPSKVAELRTVSGSRHEFVDRENRIVLEYKAKNAYRIEYLGRAGANTFKFRLLDGFGKPASGKSVSVALSGATFVGSLTDSSFISNGLGEFIIQLDSVTETPVTATMQAGSNSQTFMLEAEVTGGSLRASSNTMVNGGAVTLIFDGGAPDAGQNVSWQVISGPGALASATNSANAAGVATNVLTGDSTGNGAIVVRATVNGKDYEVTVSIDISYSLVFGIASGGGDFISAASSTAGITVTLQQNGVAYTTSSVEVLWSIISADNSANAAVMSSNRHLVTGLAWGDSPIDPLSAGNELNTSITSSTNTSNGQTSVKLTDILGERTIHVQAKVSIDGTDYTATQDVTFGRGPISVFKAPDGTSTTWSGDRPITSATTSFPAAESCGGSVTVGSPDFYDDPSWELIPHILGPSYYATGSRLPKPPQLQAVALSGNGAWLAAGWPNGNYWTGEIDSDGEYAVLERRTGSVVLMPVAEVSPVLCLR